MRAFFLLFCSCASLLCAQTPPYAVFPAAEPPYYRIRYEASTTPGELTSPAYEQPDKAPCSLWCDPRNGSDQAFQKALAELGAKSGHPELARVPWALWGHSGGAAWAGSMAMLHPERAVGVWLRSGAPPPIPLQPAALRVPMMCNLGTKEGVTIKEERFGAVWPSMEGFFVGLRAKGALIGVAVDPLTSHECGNQRFLAIPWFDACLSARLPKAVGEPLREMPEGLACLAPLYLNAGDLIAPVLAAQFTGSRERSIWLPNQDIGRAWAQYVTDTQVKDVTPPLAPRSVQVRDNVIMWEADADLESGLAHFLIERDGQLLATVPERAVNRYGRPVFQNLQYSDTPTQPLVVMRYTDANPVPGKTHRYRVVTVNTAGLKSGD